MLNEVKPNLGLLMSIRLGLAEQYGIPLDVPFRDYKAWYRWTGMEVPVQHIYADFVNQLYSKDGKPCRFEDIFEFERLSKAWDFIDGELKEYEVDEPRLSEKGLLVEPESTNHYIGSKLPIYPTRGSAVQTPTEFHVDEEWVVGKGLKNKRLVGYVFPKVHHTIFLRVVEIKKHKKYRYIELKQGHDGVAIGLIDVIDCKIVRLNVKDYTLEFNDLGDSVVVTSRHYVTNTTNNYCGRNFGISASDVITNNWREHEASWTNDTTYSFRNLSLVTGDSVSPIVTLSEPTTRTKDHLVLPIPQGHTITGDWDDTLHLFERDGQLDFEGYGYIRNLEMIPMEGSYTADFTKDAIISHTGFEHRGIFGRGIFEFERLSKAWDFIDGELKEYEVGEARISEKGLLIEPESTNTARPFTQWAVGSVTLEQRTMDTLTFTNQVPQRGTIYTNTPNTSSIKSMYIQSTEGGEAWLQSSGVAYDKYTLSTSQIRRYKITTPSGTAWGALAPLGQNTLRYPQEEVGKQITSYIRVGDVPTTRLRDSLSHPTSLEFLSVDKDEDILHKDGVFSGFGYIRKIEVKV